MRQAKKKIKLNRSFTLDEDIISTLEKLSELSLIPKSRLVQKALEELFEEMADIFKEEE